MADLPGAFWGGYISVITLVTLAAFVWLIVDVYYSKESDEELAGKTWDHDLKEGSAPAPIWWFWLLFSLLIVSVVYLMLYPGLGRFQGVLRWSQGGELSAAQEEYEAEFGERRARIAAVAVEDLLDEPRVIDAGSHVYAVHCAACHGPDGTGQADLFPNLMDAHWQWGATPTEIEQTVRNGRIAVMPPLAGPLGPDGVAAMTGYVMALAAGTADADEFESARMRYTELCSACHGVDATGTTAVGAPNLAAGVYLYGGSYEAIYETIANGRQGQMPGFGDRLDDTQVKLVTVWLRDRAAAAESGP